MLSSIATQEIFRDIGSLYSLDQSKQQWSNMGDGHLILIHNIHNPAFLLLKFVEIPEDSSKIIDDDSNTHIFQFKLKLKKKGNTSYIFKGLNTKTQAETVLAAKFKDASAAAIFQSVVVSTAKTNPIKKRSPAPIKTNINKKKKNNKKSNSLSLGSYSSMHSDFLHFTASDRDYIALSPRSIKDQLSQKEWCCEICTFDNLAQSMKCEVCNTPRPLILKKFTFSDTEEVISEQVSTPTVYHSMYGLAPPSPVCNENSDTFDWSSAQAAQVPVEPTLETDIHSTKKDFIRILTTIECNVADEDPVKLFNDLRNIARRLMKKNKKYRKLDLRNPLVQKRLFSVDGVDAYLKYLGFEEDSDECRFLICPDDQPARSVIQTAEEVCQQFIHQWKQKIVFLDLLQQSSSTLPGLSNWVSRSTSSVKSRNSTKLSITAGNINNNNNNHVSDIKSNEDIDDDGKEVAYVNAFNRVSINAINNEFNSLRDLVWTVTHESSSSSGNSLQGIILLCHRVFSDSIDLLQLLIERFEGNADENESIPSAQHWTIQVKVGNILSNWMRNFWETDFEDQVELIDKLEEFLETLEKISDKRMQLLFHKLQQIYECQLQKYEDKLRKANSHMHKKLLDQFGRPKNYKVVDQKALIIAEQITLMDFKIFAKIEKRECLGQAWKKKNRRVLAPNVLAMIDSFNHIAKWVQVLILTSPSLKARSKVIQKCIKIAGLLMELRNFSSCVAFNSALSSTCIHRLKDVWATIPRSKMLQFAEISRKLSSKNNFGILRKMHREAKAPAILHTGLFLQDLVAIGEANAEKNGTVNFKKLMKVYEKIETICMYQQERYKFQENVIIQEVIRGEFKEQEGIDSEYLFEISSSVLVEDGRK